MKKVLSFIAALLMLSSVAVMPAFAAEEPEKPENLLGYWGDLNNFKITVNQMHEGWWFWGPGIDTNLPDEQVADKGRKITEATLADGNVGKVYMFDHTSGKTNTFIRHVFSTDNLKPGTDYVFTVMAKTDDAAEYAIPGQQGLWLTFHDQKSKGLGYNTNPGKWQRLSASITTPELEGDMPSSYRLHMNFESTEGRAWMYDFGVYERAAWEEYLEALEAQAPSSTPDDNDDDDPNESEDPDLGTPSKPVSVNVQKPNSSKADVNPSSDAEPNGLSTGAIIGIVAGAVVVLAGAAVAVYFLVIKKKK